MHEHQTLRASARRLRRWVFALALSSAMMPAMSGTLTLASAPLFGSTASNVYPNIMFLLDASGSMAWDFVPDYVYAWSGSAATSCFDSGASIADNRTDCYVGDPPFMSAEFNAIYYNPDFAYAPGYDGTSTSPTPYSNQSITSATQDPYGQQRNTQLNSGNTGSTINLAINYPDRVWCNTTTRDVTDTANCRNNSSSSGYAYPDGTFKYPPSTGGTSVTAGTQSNNKLTPAASGRYIFGAPYYWRILATDYCSDADLKNCVDWTSSAADSWDGSTRYSTNMYCNGPDRKFSDCVALASLDATHRHPSKCSSSACLAPGTGAPPPPSTATVYPFPAATRFCKPDASGTNTLPLLDCQGAYSATDGHKVPKFLGYVSPSTGDYAVGDVTITDATPGLSIGGISVDGSSLGGGYTVPFGATPESVAAAIKPLLSTGTYNVSVSGRTIRISSKFVDTASPPVTYNGKVVSVTGYTGVPPISSGDKAKATVTVPAVPPPTDGSSPIKDYRLGPLCVGTVHGSGSSQTCDKTTSGDSLGTIISGTVNVTADLSTTTGQATAASQIATAISSYPSGGYSASVAGNVVTVTAPTVGTMTSPINSMTVDLADVAGTGIITIGTGTTPLTASYGVSSIKVTTTPGPTTISTGSFSVTADLSSASDRATVAATVATKIGSGYSAMASGGAVTVTAPAGGDGLLSVIGAATAAVETITVNAGTNATKTYKINSIKVGSTVVATNIQFTVNLSTNSGRYAAATAIKNAIGGGYIASCTGGASCSGNVVTLTASTAGSAGNGAITYVSNEASTPVTITIAGTISSTTVSAIKLSGCTDSTFNTPSSPSTSPGILSAATLASGNAIALASNIASKVSGSAPVSATSSGNTVTFDAKSGNKGGLNGCIIAISASGGSPTFSFSPSSSLSGNDPVTSLTFTAVTIGTDALPTAVSGITGATTRIALTINTTSFSAGTNAIGTLPTVTNNFAGGAVAGSEKRLDVGLFKRCDITSAADCYGLGVGKFPRAATRTDCVNATPAPGYCTYAEESTNFANWYAFYRTRMQAMKTSAGLAFSGLGSTYRVGLATIQTSSSSSSDFLKIDDFKNDFTATPAIKQLQNWYTKFYARQPNNGTPLRSALAKIGQMYAAKGPLFDADPVKYACQQNVTILTTDGYWNTDKCSNVKQVDNSTNIDQRDGSPAVSRVSIPSEMWDGDKGGTCLDDTGGPSSVGTLADVAYYYAHTDLRTPAPGLGNCAPGSGTETDVCANSVSNSNPSEPRYQHMSTYTLGLGVSGTLRYQRDYDTASSGAFYEIKNGLKTWPQVSPDTQTTVDDLWHAAVNGFGHYFSANNPALLRNNLADALSAIKSSVGSGSAAAASAQTLSASGGNYVYAASYKTLDWIGNLVAYSIDATTAAINPIPEWSVSSIAADTSTGAGALTGTLRVDAAAVMSGKLGKVSTDSDTRNIYLLNTADATGSKLRDFVFSALSGTEQAYFVTCSPSAPIVKLNQCPTLPTPTVAAASAETLVNYLRGQTGMEMESSTNIHQAYRHRKEVLGDIGASSPKYVGPPSSAYVDPGYAKFVDDNKLRAPTIYVGANDGMMHAFAADVGPTFGKGDERWAYIPAQLLPALRNLANDNYKTNHQYYVNGPMVVADVCIANCADKGTSSTASTATWRTILVSGYGAGGRGYFAVDVTDPANPKGLWEIDTTTDADFGYSFGNPIITKRPDGKWVVLLTSGYNNSSGEGILFEVEPDTGRVLTKISNKAGTVTNPSGLAKIESFISDATHDNTTNSVYAGDLNGNVWRFNLKVGAESVVKIGVVADNAGTRQPITVKAVMTTLDDSAQTPYVIVGTGLLLQETDKSNTRLQSIYGFTDNYDSLCTGPAADLTDPTTCQGAAKGRVTTYAYTTTPPSTVVTVSSSSSGSTSEVPSTKATVGNCAGANTTGLSAGCPYGARNQLPGQTMVSDGEDSLGRALRKTAAIAGTPDKTPTVSGCYIDWPDAGERVNIDPVITNGEVVVATNVPDSNFCSAGGHSYVNAFNYKTCKGDLAVQIADALISGITIINTSGGDTHIVIEKSTGGQPEDVGTVQPGSSGFQGKRSGWRILGD